MSGKFKDYFSTQSDAYAHYRPKYPQQLAQALADFCAHKHMALDCGCGSGQFSVLLADHFDKVVATDASSKQIENAELHPKVTYKVAPAETIPSPDNSVDMISVAQAAHWLDLDKFYVEAKRVLKPDGVLALISYQNAILENSECDHILKTFYGETLDNYWPPERRLVESGYKTLEFPFHEVEFTPPKMQMAWSFNELYGYVTTWSAFKAFEAAGEHAAIENFKNKLATAWGDIKQQQQITWPLSLRVGRTAA